MFKSGTASGYFSLWCLGSHPAHTVGVWAGSLDRRSAPGATGSSVPATVARGPPEELEERPGQPADRAGGTQAAPPPGLGGRQDLHADRLPGLTCLPGRAGRALPARTPCPSAPARCMAGGRGWKRWPWSCSWGRQRTAGVLHPRDGATFYRDWLESPQAEMPCGDSSPSR